MWISIKDRLPEIGHYLVAVDSDEGRFSLSMEFNGKDWIYEGEPIYCQSAYIEVTHWQPLPEPPEEE